MAEAIEFPGGVTLTERDVRIGDRRIPRDAITGIEFDRAGTGDGAMIFLGKDGQLARAEFKGMDRAKFAALEAKLAPPRKGAIRVTLDREDYGPGETVSGDVRVDWPEARPVRGVRVGLVGAEETRISRTRGSGKHRRTVTYTECHEIIGEEITLWGGRRVGWFKAMGEGLSRLFRRLDYDELPAGRHKFPFEFELPSWALPSYSGRHADVTYRLYANVDVPLAFDLVFEGQLPVVGPRDLRIEARKWRDEQRAEGLLKAFHASVDTKLDIDESELRPGRRVSGRLHIVNQSRKRIRGIDLGLVAYEHARAEGYVEDSEVSLASGRLTVPEPDADVQDAEFSIAIPSGGVPYEGRYSRLTLALRASLDVAMGFDAAIEVPLTTD